MNFNNEKEINTISDANHCYGKPQVLLLINFLKLKYNIYTKKHTSHEYTACNYHPDQETEDSTSQPHNYPII